MSEPKDRSSWHFSDVIKYTLVAGVVVFISFLYPNNVKFKYQFEQGKTWRYEDLYAPFDFPIKKLSSEIDQEVANLDDQFSPYYELSTQIVEVQKEKFKTHFERQLEKINTSQEFDDVRRYPERYLTYGNQFLDNIYGQGIIELTNKHQNKPKDFVINVISGNTSRRETIDNLRDQSEAISLLSDSLPYAKLAEPEFLLLTLEEMIVPNLFYNDTLTQRFLEQAVAEIPTSRGMVQNEALIIKKGEIITDETYQKLYSFREQYKEEITKDKSYIGIRAGYLLLTSLIIGVFIAYLNLYNKTLINRNNKLIFILLWLPVYSYLVYAVERTDILSAYMVPFCIVPIVIKTFYNARLALFTHIVVVLIASFLSSLGYEFTFLQILAGIVVLLSDVGTRDFSSFFSSILYVFLAYALSYLGLSLIQTGSLMEIDWSVYTWIFINVFLTLLAYPLIPLLERLFGFISSITLVELSDMNRPLLRELAIKTPGTLQHSLQVANMSEAAAQEIGADPLLVKVAALYHDIGKTDDPEYFIENQAGSNPHNEISNLDSAKIIIGHVTKGIDKAKKFKLPNLLIDFIRTHHGTTRTEYFYRNHIKENPDKEFDETLFRYPGPRPTTREQTILMLADSIEAACKSLKEPTEKELMELVDKIVAGKITQGQLIESKLCFQELEACVQVFKKVIKSVYHSRIKYPESK